MSVLYQIVCVFSQIKDKKNIEQNFHSVARILPQGGTWGAGESKKNFIVGICDGAPSTACSSITFRPGQTQTQVCSYKRIGRDLERLYIQPIFWYKSDHIPENRGSVCAEGSIMFFACSQKKFQLRT